MTILDTIENLPIEERSAAFDALSPDEQADVMALFEEREVSEAFEGNGCGGCGQCYTCNYGPPVVDGMYDCDGCGKPTPGDGLAALILCPDCAGTDHTVHVFP